MPIKLKTLPTGEVYWGQRHGQPVFYEPNESDAAFRQAAHDAIEITELKRENVRLLENSKWKPKWQPTHGHKATTDKILVLKADEYHHEFQYREGGKIHRMATRNFWKYFYVLPPGSK